MGGWTRLAIVLSVIYWAVAGFLCWDITLAGPNDYGLNYPLILFGFFAFIYAAAAGIWWALAAFFRNR